MRVVNTVFVGNYCHVLNGNQLVQLRGCLRYRHTGLNQSNLKHPTQLYIYLIGTDISEPIKLGVLLQELIA
jgi:hypothetical protein